MFLKDHLIDTYQKASLDKNYLILENVINRWVHRFGIETMNELLAKNQDQVNLIEVQREENQDQINLIEGQGEENQDQINLIIDQGEENQDQINLIEGQGEENQDQINLELLENIQYQKEIEFKSKEEKMNNDNEIINKDIYESYKNKYIEKEELPLPNIKSLRKWIKNEKKAS